MHRIVCYRRIDTGALPMPVCNRSLHERHKIFKVSLDYL